MLTKNEFKARRDYLMSQIGPNGIGIIAAAKEHYRTVDWAYPYRQSSDFHYLTGFGEPEAIAVFIPKRKAGEFVLFNRPREPEKELWTGKFAGQKGACKNYGADQSFSIQEIDTIIPALISGRKKVYFDIGRDKDFDAKIISWVNTIKTKVRAGINAPTELINIGSIVHEMRMKKHPAEINLMRKAASITIDAHLRAMRACKPRMYEYELAAELHYEFIKQGGNSPSFEPIVGGGINGCTLHYSANNCKLRDGELVLVDAGVEYEGYCADITRTFPINGHFTREQRAIYQAVLDAQMAVIAKIKPGVPWIELQKTSERVITKRLKTLGILKGNTKKLWETKAFKPFYMHNIGHWLGLDNHDVGLYKIDDQWRKLEPGMTFTVEPGIYIGPNISKVDKKWWNIGVRIEDDVLVTKKGCEVLTGRLPKTVKEIEGIVTNR